MRLISIVIPTLQEEKVIGATLACLKQAITSEHEIVVSDGGSTDATVAIARGFADRVLLNESGVRQTIAQGRNIGARGARGEFLVFLDADCTIENPAAFFEEALAHFSADAELVGLVGYIKVLAAEETFADKLVFGLMNIATRFNNNVLRRGDAPGGEFQMARRSAFEAIGGYREDLVTCEDRDLLARLSRKGRVRTDPALVVFHSGRRAHNVGWLRLILLFFVNTLSFRLRGKVVSTEWTLER